MKLSIFAKIFGSCLLITIALSISIPLLSFKTIRGLYTDAYKENLKNLAITLRPQISSLAGQRRFQELDAFVKSLKKQIHTRITVIDKEGTVVADSERDPRAMENHRARPEIVEALSGAVGKSQRFSVTVEEEMLYVALPIENEDRIFGAIRLSAYLKEINILLSELKMEIFWIAFIITILSLAFALIVSRSISSPLKKIVRAAKSLSMGQFATRVFLREDDELKELGDSFNDMASRMDQLFKEISRSNEELNTVISSIQEMLLVFDRDERIKLSNDSFKKLIGTDVVEGKFYWEVLRSPEFGDLVKKVKTRKKHLASDVRLKDRIFLCSITFLASTDEMVAVFHDITEFKNLEQIKKDFIANMSHELRTPLTAIKGFAETLETEEDIKNPRYIEIIKRHADRLMYIVNDLLLLSELEDKGIRVELEEVSLKKIIENIGRIFEQQMKEKDLKLIIEVPEDIPAIKADPFKLEQMFINLLDNAIKYTENGEVTLSLEHSPREVTVEVKDTGIGIPAEHLQRIFERFYVVDKSRSKKLGGTGLGLSIVKHIVLLHHGRIHVESTSGQGTKFIVTLPIDSE
jgi:two-component system, OmpR family, phosphate regulon sensor histidine kinase PhoR